MRQIKLITVLFFSLTLICCGPSIKNDKTIGPEETKTFNQLIETLTERMKRKFGGNLYQNDKITPSEDAETISIGIPNAVTYIFSKNNSKFYKGDLNNDQKWDLVISADFQEAYSTENKVYFVYTQSDKGYKLFGEFVASKMVWPYASDKNFKLGIFNLDSISDGALIGYSDYRNGDESYFRDYSYRVATEKFKLNLSDSTIQLVSQSELLKKNPETKEYAKADTTALK